MQSRCRIRRSPNLNYKEINGLRQLTWTKVGELSSLLLVMFVADASVTLWRQGDRTERRRWSLTQHALCILVAAGNSALLHAGVIHAPYLISFLLSIVAAMGYVEFASLAESESLLQNLTHITE